MSEFSSGVYFVPLAMAPSADHILWALAEYLNLQFDSHMEPLTQLLNYFRDKSLLLVLDNFDHLISTAGIIGEILQAAPTVKILVTSRERLSLYGEVRFGRGHGAA
ncbi:MAG: hypothetical protein IPK19_16665 [Chloroflexi bacterium]|nr:hypothetical protein [Chloroflexota bacterium]